jgi:hypothetical protein
MESIEQIIQMNNEGVSLLGTGDDQQAVSVFTTSLLALQRLIGTSENAPLSKVPEYSVDFAAAVPAKNALQHLEGSSYFIYNRPLSITLSSNADIQLYSACTILNLAMAYHRQAKKTCNQTCLTKAESMYEMIITLLKSRMDDTSLSVRIIAVNNLSEIHYENGRFEQSREELQWLSSIIHHGGTKLDFFDQSDLNRLLLNVLILLTPPQAAGAA